MKTTIRRLLSFVLAAVMLFSLLPSVFAAEEVASLTVGAAQEEPVLHLVPETEKKSGSLMDADELAPEDYAGIDALFAEIDAMESAPAKKNASQTDLADAAYEMVLASENYVGGSIERNGNTFTWWTTEGIHCIYDPYMREKKANMKAPATPQPDGIYNEPKVEKGGSPSGNQVYLVAPYYGYDSSFTDQYKNQATEIASAMGDTDGYTLYSGTGATVDKVATAISNGAVVIFDSHGTTDYSNGDDNVTGANYSYLCLNTNSGITSADYNDGCLYGSGYAYVNGDTISNHMTKNSPGGLLWMAICLGMATNTLCYPLRDRGVEVVCGYSQSVTFGGEYLWSEVFWDNVLSGTTVATASSAMKSKYGNWDVSSQICSYYGWSGAYTTISSARANYAAFPVVVSDEDTHPGQRSSSSYGACSLQTVKSTYTLFGDGSGDSGSSSSSITISFSCPSGVSASSITTTAGTAFTLPTPTGTPSANAYDYTFAGWATSTVSDTTTVPTLYAAGKSVSATSSLTLYAVYTYTSGGSTYYTTSLQYAAAEAITISFSCPSGVSASSITTTAGTAFTLPTPTGTPTANAYSYTFAGWVTGTVSDTTTQPTIYAAGNSVYANSSLTLYALYTYTSGGTTYYTTSLQNSSGSSSAFAPGDSGTYVIAANVGGTYYAMSNTFASKISGTVITVTDGYVSEADAEGYAVELTYTGGSYSIYNGEKYLKYGSGTNLTTATAAYNWTISAGANGTWRVTSATSGRGLVYRAGTYNQFGGYALSNISAGSTEYYDIEILPIGSSSSSDGTESGTYYLIDSASALASDSFVFLADATGSYSSNSHYALQTVADGSYACLAAIGADFDSAPAAITATSTLAWIVTYSGGKLIIRDASGNYLRDTTDTEGISLELSTTADTWTPVFYTDGTVSLQSGSGYYLSLRDDLETAGSNGNPMFCVSSSLNTGSCYFYLYRATQTSGSECSHSSTTVVNASAATCTATGYTGDTVCNDCGETISVGSVISAAGHNYTSKVTAPTCTTAGYTTYTCSKCGDSYTSDNVSALGHSYNSVVTAPTCDTQGYTTYTCSTCGDNYTGSYVVPTGHSYGAPVDNGDGTHTAVCACGDTETAAHTYVDGACECGAAQVTGPVLETGLKFYQKSLALESYIAVNFTILNSTVADYDSFYCELIHKKADGTNRTVTDNGTALVAGVATYFEIQLAAKEMADKLYVTLYAEKDGVLYCSETVEYSIMQSAMDSLAKIGSANYASKAATVTMYVDMLNYGAAAQTHFAYNTENPANAELTDAELAYATTEELSVENKESITSDGYSAISFFRNSLGLESRIELQFTADLGSYAPENVVCRFEYGGSRAEVEGSSMTLLVATYYTAIFDLLPAKDVRTIVNVTFYDTEGNRLSETKSCSIESYAAYRLADSSTPETLAHMLTAMMRYGDSCKVNFG